MKLPSVRRMLKRFIGQEEAATATEYAVMLGLIIVVVMVTLQSYGSNLAAKYITINTELFG